MPNRIAPAPFTPDAADASFRGEGDTTIGTQNQCRTFFEICETISKHTTSTAALSRPGYFLCSWAGFSPVHNFAARLKYGYSQPDQLL